MTTIHLHKKKTIKQSLVTTDKIITFLELNSDTLLSLHKERLLLFYSILGTLHNKENSFNNPIQQLPEVIRTSFTMSHSSLTKMMEDLKKLKCDFEHRLDNKKKSKKNHQKKSKRKIKSDPGVIPPL